MLIRAMAYSGVATMAVLAPRPAELGPNKFWRPWAPFIVDKAPKGLFLAELTYKFW